MKKLIIAITAVGLSACTLHGVETPFRRLVKGEVFPVPNFQDIDIVRSAKGASDPLSVLELKLTEAKELFFEGEVTKGAVPTNKKSSPSLAQYYNVINAIASAIKATPLNELKKYFDDKEKYESLKEKMQILCDGLVRHKLLRKEMFRYGPTRIAQILLEKPLPQGVVFPLFALGKHSLEEFAAMGMDVPKDVPEPK